ncbi:uncharacterized protein LOC129718899 [Wyeomyia smithii]|uniref:uncharacterized protein LOC129718899 n=1 Tax=Wyeomyia smithii TaxID=174621 RepID=UPI002467D72A|nr:uncharacterized protein LOC129718899 [Wyeomyia smithii]
MHNMLFEGHPSKKESILSAYRGGGRRPGTNDRRFERTSTDRMFRSRIVDRSFERSAIKEEGFHTMIKVLSSLGIQSIRVPELRRDSVRVELFKQAVNSLKQILKVDCPVYYQDTDVPIVRDIIDNYGISTKSEKFQILTLLASSWSRQKMIDVTGCSKWFAAKSLKVRDTKGILKLPDTCISLSESERKAHAEATQFFHDCTTTMPGIKDTISVRTSSKRGTRQKRLLLGSLNEIFANFKDLFPDSKIGFTMFAKFRPPECILSGSSGTHTVCVCA